MKFIKNNIYDTYCILIIIIFISCTIYDVKRKIISTNLILKDKHHIFNI